jgi:hypothetical protein
VGEITRAEVASYRSELPTAVGGDGAASEFTASWMTAYGLACRPRAAGARAQQVASHERSAA